MSRYDKIVRDRTRDFTIHIAMSEAYGRGLAARLERDREQPEPETTEVSVSPPPSRINHVNLGMGHTVYHPDGSSTTYYDTAVHEGGRSYVIPGEWRKKLQGANQ